MTTQNLIALNKCKGEKAVSAALRKVGYMPDFDALPDSAMVRVSQLVRDPKHPAKPAPLPISAATLWRKVAGGSFPQPLKLGARTTVWRVSDIRAWMAVQEGSAA